MAKNQSLPVKGSEKGKKTAYNTIMIQCDKCYKSVKCQRGETEDDFGEVIFEFGLKIKKKKKVFQTKAKPINTKAQRYKEYKFAGNRKESSRRGQSRIGKLRPVLTLLGRGKI